MFRPIELYIGLRYTRARRRNHFISFISLTSMLGIALGVLALITVLSVMNGFEKEIRERILGFASHATISGSGGRLENWEPVAAQAQDDPHVVGVAPYIEGQAMLVVGQAVKGVLVRGIEPELEPEVSDIHQHMEVGALTDLRPRGYGIILGSELARALGVRPGEKVTMVVPQARITPAGILPRLRRFTVVGVFQVGMNEYDHGLALVHIEDAARLQKLGDSVSGVRLKLDDLFLAPEVVRDIAANLGGLYYVNDWTRRHANFFRALRLEKRMMFIILLLIVAVAAFNIVSTLVMVVTDKESDIAILRTLGVAPAGVMLIFIVQGVVIGTVGTLVGAIAGVVVAQNLEAIVAWLETQVIGSKIFPADVYYINEVPSDMHWSDVSVIAAVAFGLTLISTLYPAWRAARTQPAEALRYE